MGESIIIERPELQTRRQRGLFAVLTGMLWVAWSYLWLPVVSVVEWFLGLPSNYQSFVLHGYSALQEVLPIYCGVIAVMGGSLVAWAIYNMVRFKGRERRSSRSAVDLDTLADFHAVKSTALAHWQDARLLAFDHDDSGSIATVTLLSGNRRRARRAPAPDRGADFDGADVTYVVRSRARSHDPAPFGLSAPLGAQPG